MDKKLLDTLVCPLCHSKLSYMPKQEILLCQFDRLSFPFDEKIPVLMADKASSLTREQLDEITQNG